MDLFQFQIKASFNNTQIFPYIFQCLYIDFIQSSNHKLNMLISVFTKNHTDFI